MLLYMRDIVKGMRRRKKELLLIVTVEFLAVFFVMVVLLFQHLFLNNFYEKYNLKMRLLYHKT